MKYRILSLVKKELLELSRDRFLVFIVIVLPLVELLLIGFGTANPTENLTTAILDLDQSQHSRQLVQVLENSRGLNIKYYSTDGDELDSLLDRGEVSAAFIIPHGFAADLANADRQAELQVIVDGSQSMVAGEAVVAAQAAVATFEQSILISSPGGSMILEPRVRVWFNETLSMAISLIPPEMIFILAFIALVIPAWGIARERERGTLEQLMISPLRTYELFLGKAIPAVIVAFTVFLLMLGIVTFLFDVPLRGFLAAIFGFSLFFIIVYLGLGVIFSVFSRTQMQALLLVFLFTMVENVFSGYAIPVESMPTVINWLSNLSPLKHALIVFRGIMVKGSSLGAFPTEIIALILLGVGIWAIAIISLRRRSPV